MTVASAGREPQDSHPATLGLLLAGIALGVLYVGINFAFPGLAPTGIPTILIRLAVHAVILAGLWLGLARMDFSFPAARRSGLPLSCRSRPGWLSCGASRSRADFSLWQLLRMGKRTTRTD
jgi:hypothetical protein